MNRTTGAGPAPADATGTTSPTTGPAPGPTPEPVVRQAAQRALRWGPLAMLIMFQICYPLAGGGARSGLTIAIVLTGFAASAGHALVTRGWRAGLALVTIGAGGGLAVEALGVATGFPFGHYAYSDALGPRVAGVALVVPLAWAWMAWPSWLVALRAASSRTARVLLAGAALASWDLFLDPQMVAEGYWHWSAATPALPGVPGIPVSNYLGWLAVAVLLMAALSATAGARAAAPVPARDTPMMVMFGWAYVASLLAHALFLGLPGSAWWGGLGMGVVVLILLVRAHGYRR